MFWKFTNGFDDCQTPNTVPSKIKFKYTVKRLIDCRYRRSKQPYWIHCGSNRKQKSFWTALGTRAHIPWPNDADQLQITLCLVEHRATKEAFGWTKYKGGNLADQLRRFGTEVSRFRMSELTRVPGGFDWLLDYGQSCREGLLGQMPGMKDCVPTVPLHHQTKRKNRYLWYITHWEFWCVHRHVDTLLSEKMGKKSSFQNDYGYIKFFG